MGSSRITKYMYFSFHGKKSIVGRRIPHARFHIQMNWGKALCGRLLINTSRKLNFLLVAVQSLLGLSQCSHSHSWVRCYCLPTNLQMFHGCKIEGREEDTTLYERKWFILKCTVFKYNIKISRGFSTLLWVRVSLLGAKLRKNKTTEVGFW